MTLVLNNSLDHGNVGTAGFSTPFNPLVNRVETALGSIKLELSQTVKAVSHQFSTISAQPILGKFKDFVALIKGRFAPQETSVELVDMSGKSEVSVETLVEDFENEASIPSALSRFAFTVLEKTKSVITHPKEAFEKAEEVFETVKKKIEVIETPLEVVNCGLEWAALTETLEHYAEPVAHALGKAAVPLGLISLFAKVKKVGKAIFEARAEGAEKAKTSELVSAGLSILSSLCSALLWLHKVGLLFPALAISGGLNTISGLCGLAMAISDLVDSIKNYEGLAKLAKALLNVAVAVGTLVLVAYAVAHLHVLLLIMGTGILILNIKYPDKEHDEVKQEHVEEVQVH